MLDGAKAFAIPLRLGQSMTVTESAGSEIVWRSHQPNGELWFSAQFDLMDFKPTKSSDPDIAQKLSQILRAACRLDSEFLSKWKKYKVTTYLDFDRNWGLGSSSTLISCIAQWADVNPYILLFNTIGGSGYDVACAMAEGPILYQLGEDQLFINHVDFEPRFKDQLYFVYLGKKANSEEARKLYFANKANANGAKDHISEISSAIPDSKDLKSFEKFLREHDGIVSKSLNMPTVQENFFKDFWGIVKSLGAWGGDFVLATSDRPPAETKKYFTDKGFSTILTYDELVLPQTN